MTGAVTRDPRNERSLDGPPQPVSCPGWVVPHLHPERARTAKHRLVEYTALAADWQAMIPEVPG